MSSVDDGGPSLVDFKLLETAEILFKYAFAFHEPSQYLQSFSWGKHTAKYEELALSEAEEGTAHVALEHTATYGLAVQMDTYLMSLFSGARFAHPDSSIQSAAWISRLMRNAFAHNPFLPQWKTYPECDNRQFRVAGIIELDTTGINGKLLRYEQFGGPLALLRLSQYVRRLSVPRQ